MMRRIVVVVAGLVAAWFGLLVSAQVAEGAASPEFTHAYDGHPHSGLTLDSTSDRGPPATYGFAIPQGAVSPGSDGALARPRLGASQTTSAYDAPARLAPFVSATTTTVRDAQANNGWSVVHDRNGVAANGGERLLWTSWQNYPKVTQGGREYAQIGDRLYSHHAVDRLQPSGLGAPAGATGAGRSISPNFVEDVLSSTKGVPVKGPNGEARLTFTSGTVQVITENNIVITVITR